MSVRAVLREQGCQVAARTYRAWRNDPAPAPAPATRTVSDAVLIDALRATAGQPESLYGRREMAAYRRRRGHLVAHCTVDRLMRGEGMNGVIRARSHRTTVPGKDGIRAGDLLDRDFPPQAGGAPTATAPDLVWVADFTYVRTWAGFVDVAFIVDVFSQKIVGWHAMTTKVTELVLTCLRMATWRRGQDGHPVGRRLIHHSDAGAQYRSLRFTEHLPLEGIAPSIGSVGDVVYATATWVERWNNARLHSTLDYVTPTDHEQAHYAAITASQPDPRPV